MRGGQVRKHLHAPSTLGRLINNLAGAAPSHTCASNLPEPKTAMEAGTPSLPPYQAHAEASRFCVCCSCLLSLVSLDPSVLLVSVLLASVLFAVVFRLAVIENSCSKFPNTKCPCSRLFVFELFERVSSPNFSRTNENRLGVFEFFGAGGVFELFRSQEMVRWLGPGPGLGPGLAWARARLGPGPSLGPALAWARARLGPGPGLGPGLGPGPAPRIAKTYFNHAV